MANAPVEDADAGAGDSAGSPPLDATLVAWLEGGAVESVPVEGGPFDGGPVEDTMGGLIDSVRVLLRGSSADQAALERLVALFGRRDPRLLSLLDSAATRTPPAAPPEWLESEDLPAVVRTNAVLAVACRLHARRMYEEALNWLAGVDADSATDAAAAPVLVHYYRAVAAHQLVRLEEARESAERLLARPAGAARRHLNVARLILRDTEEIDPESVDHLARTMNDVRRRLSLGRSADPEQALQQGVIDALDKLIDEAEKQQQQQQANAGAQQAPSRPAQQSRPSELKGPGEVDPRDVANGGDWGSLPPDERERVTQQIGRDFPGYYRDLIQAYFQSLVKEPQPASGEPPSPANP
ncbi:MAG: hypothetical protein AAF790_04535 [Planctomycetota bacterium]